MSADASLRLDVYLSKTRLVVPRTSAKRACDNGIVSLNGTTAKPATPVHTGDTISVRFSDQDLVVRVVRLPGASVRKSDAASHYDVLEDTRYT